MYIYELKWKKRILVIAILYNNTLTVRAEFFFCSISLYVLMNVAGTISIDKNQFVPTV